MFFSYLFDLWYPESGEENVFNGICWYALFYGVFNIRETYVDVCRWRRNTFLYRSNVQINERIGIIGEELVSAYAFDVFFCE